MGERNELRETIKTDFPSELVEAAAKALAGEPRCYCPDDWRADPSPRCPFHGDGEWPTHAHYLQARAVIAAVVPLVEQRRTAGEDVDMRDRAWEYVHRCPSCGRYFDSPSKCLPDGVMTEPVRERVPNAVRCPAMDGRCGRVAGHAGPCVEQEATDA